MKISCLVNFRDPAPGAVAACLKSIMEQTHKDWEALVCDDAGDRPGPLIEAEEAAKMDARIRLRRNTARRGMFANLVTGAEMATGEILVQVDGDDMLATTGALARIHDEHASGADATWGSCATEAEIWVAKHLFLAPGRWLIAPRSIRRSLFAGARDAGAYASGAPRDGCDDIDFFEPALDLAKSPRPINEVLYWIRPGQ